MTALQLAIQEKVFSNGVRALQGLHLDVAAGQFVAIVGPSGTGKSTLLNSIAGLDTDFVGQIQCEPSQPRIGFMFQEAQLIPWLTVQQNIDLVLQGLEQQHRQQAQTRITNWLQQLGLQGFADAYPRQLSGGMQRRVSLLRAFIIQPHLLLMDEPFQSLDEPTAQQLRQLLLVLWQDTQATVLFVTHDLREALSVADRIVFLSARPAQVVLDLAVTYTRPRTPEIVQRVHHDLLQRHPDLLAGQINPAEGVSHV